MDELRQKQVLSRLQQLAVKNKSVMEINQENKQKTEDENVNKPYLPIGLGTKKIESSPFIDRKFNDKVELSPM